MRIVIDFDDTIVNTRKVVNDFLVRYNTVLNSNEEKISFYKEHIDEMTPKLEFMPSALEVLNELSLNHELYILTARDKFYSNNIIDLTNEFVSKNKIPVREVIYGCLHEEKALKCKELKADLFIDNDTRNCLPVKKIGINVILFGDYEHNEGLFQIRTWKEIAEYIRSIYGR